MKIITVNLPVVYIKALDSLVGEDGLYPSRSELIRVAIREFLIKELEIARKYAENPEKDIAKAESELDELHVRIPIEVRDGMNTVKQYKVYKIIKR